MKASTAAISINLLTTLIFSDRVKAYSFYEPDDDPRPIDTPPSWIFFLILIGVPALFFFAREKGEEFAVKECIGFTVALLMILTIVWEIFG